MSKPSINPKPKYISSAPSGEDLFEGQSQEKIANTIFDLINSKSLPNNVIGLEGKWGSGKSNVVSILNKKFDSTESDFIFFTYDAWAHQEDLTRRTFLEGLITNLKKDEKFNETVDWENELNKLLAKKSIKNTAKFPKIKFYWILIMAAILLFSFLNILYDDFIVSRDFFSKIQLPYLKLFLSKYLLPVGVFIWGLCELKKEYKAFNNDDDTKDLNYKERLKRLLYIFSGSDLESKELEHTLEDEPTVRKFKEYFEKITSDLKSDGLVIVFDNMDRLSKSDKVLSLWSSIHTFFAEEKVDNVWVIIPYDKQHLSNHFDENDDDDKVDNFIGKTFSTTFRISPPVLSDWKKFFERKFKEAFEEIIKQEDIDLISSLFELVLDINYRKPRDIITFINNLVSLHLQHNSDINIKYLALFALRSKSILDNPLVSISSKNFLKEEKHLFNNDSELEESLAAIVYNVSKEKSSEVLLKNNIEELFIRPNIETLNSVKLHSEFGVYFNNIIQKSNFSGFTPKSVSTIFNEVEGVIPKKQLKSYWEKFANNLGNRPDKHFQTLEDWHKNIILKTSRKTSKMIADQIVYSCNKDINKEEGKITYYNTLFDLVKFVKENKVKIKMQIDEIEFSPEDFISYVDKMSNKFNEDCKFEELKIVVDIDELNNYFIDSENGVEEETYSALNVIKYLININKNAYVFDDLSEKIEEEIETVAYTEKDKIHKLIEISKAIYGKSKISLLEETIGTNFLNHHANKFDKPYFDIIANQIAHLKSTAPRSQYFTTELNKTDNAEKISIIIQHYITYGDLLKLVVDTNRKYPLLDEIILQLTKNSFGFSQKININWVYKNIDNIRDELFQDNFEDFLRHFDTWKKYFSKNVTEENVFDLGTEIIDLAADSENHNYECILHYYNVAIQKFKNVTKEEWLDNFETELNLIYAFNSFFDSDLIDKSITKGNSFMEAYEEFLKEVAKRNKTLPVNAESWNKLLKNDLLDNRKLTRLNNDFLDYLIDHTEITNEEVELFSYGLFNYSSNLYSDSRKADEFIRKMIIPLDEKLDFLDDLLADYLEEIIKVINSSSGEYNLDLSELFTNAKNSGSENEAIISKVFDETELKEIVEKEETEETEE